MSELRAALYARVSTDQQTTDNQLLALRDYAMRNGWTPVEYIDQGVSGAKESRPALDRLMADARRRLFDVVIVWRLDRFGRSLRHIVTSLDELRARGVTFVSLGEGIDLSTSAGKLQLHILAALAEFERSRIQERVNAGIARARRMGKHIGRRASIHPASAAHAIVADASLSASEVASRIGVSKSTVNLMRRKMRKETERKPHPAGSIPRTENQART
jgi:DNA invertase Pin-like site-specific DNA recombinase